NRARGGGSRSIHADRVSGGLSRADGDRRGRGLAEGMRLEESPLQLAGAWPGRIGELSAVVADPIVSTGADEIATLAFVKDCLDHGALRAAIPCLGAGHALGRTIQCRNRRGA